MAQLISLRQRIKAIETIKKITHAMRLISMSMHAQLKHRTQYVDFYTTTLEHLVQQFSVATTYPAISQEIPHKNLVIYIGSQKGLCGNFNLYLAHFLHEQIADLPCDILVVGNKAYEYLQRSSLANVIHHYAHHSLRNLTDNASSITSYILAHIHTYASITIVSNQSKTFFSQKPERCTLLPLPTSSKKDTQLSEYHWEQDKQEISEAILHHYIEAKVYQALFSSLMAEQAARFISMDSSTRNAKKLLEVTRLQYNKLRQTNITKELTELSSSF